MNRKTRALILATSMSLILAVGVQAKSGTVVLNTGQEADNVTGTGAVGSFTWSIDGLELCYTLEVRSLTSAPVAAHIHEAPKGIAGPVVVPLTAPSGATASTGEICITATEGSALAEELEEIAAEPEEYYVNVHTPAYPAGEIRGQLK
jgi:Cu/Zn superoxide dismutase